MASDRDTDTVGGDRPPADAERPPVSRVGDELLERSGNQPSAEDDEDTERAEEIEREAFDAAQEKGWDKNVKDT